MLEKVDDRALISRMKTLLREERALRAEFIVHLAEFDRRRLYLVAGCSSLFIWLTEHLRLSKASAYRRITAARLVTELPLLVDAIREGSISLSKLCALKDAINLDNAAALLERAATLSEGQVQELAVTLDGRSRPPIRDSIRPIPPPVVATPAPDLFTAGERQPSSPTPQDAPPAAGPELRTPPPSPPAPHGARPPSPSAPAEPPRSPPRSVVTMSVGPEFLRLLDEVRAAFSHTHPGASLEVLFGECMKLALAQRAKKTRAQVERPRAQSAKEPKGRYIPAPVRRAVWARDGGRCTYVADDGRRCDATHRLELHHRIPFARGGKPIAENLALMCSRHNDLEARRAFGDEVMDRHTRRRAPEHALESGP